MASVTLSHHSSVTHNSCAVRFIKAVQAKTKRYLQARASGRGDARKELGDGHREKARGGQGKGHVLPTYSTLEHNRHRFTHMATTYNW